MRAMCTAWTSVMYFHSWLPNPRVQPASAAQSIRGRGGAREKATGTLAGDTHAVARADGAPSAQASGRSAGAAAVSSVCDTTPSCGLAPTAASGVPVAAHREYCSTSTGAVHTALRWLRFPHLRRPFAGSLHRSHLG